MQSVFSVVCSLPELVAIHPWMALGEQYWGTTFPGEYARQLMVQALFLLSGSSAPLPLHPGKECTVPQLPVPGSLGHRHICALLPVCAPPHGQVSGHPGGVGLSTQLGT